MPLLQDYDPSRIVKKTEGDRAFITAGEKPISNYPFIAAIEGPVKTGGKRDTAWCLIPSSVAYMYLIMSGDAKPEKAKEANPLPSPFTGAAIFKLVEVPASEDYLGNR